jgi:uncharacterized tellurite resistance protein B-like protein
MEKEHIKRSILATLMKLSTADRKITEQEFLFIKDISRRIGIMESELEGIIKEYDQLILKIPKDEQARMSILYYLLFLMKIDGEANEEEQKLVKEIGFRLGFRTQMVDNMINVIKEYEDKPIPADTLLNNIKKYLN